MATVKGKAAHPGPAKPLGESMSSFRRRRRACARAVLEAKLAHVWCLVADLEAALFDERAFWIDSSALAPEVAGRVVAVVPVVKAEVAGGEVDQTQRVVRNLAMHEFSVPVDEFKEMPLPALNRLQREGRGRREGPGGLGRRVEAYGGLLQGQAPSSGALALC